MVYRVVFAKASGEIVYSDSQFTSKSAALDAMRFYVFNYRRGCRQMTVAGEHVFEGAAGSGGVRVSDIDPKAPGYTFTHGSPREVYGTLFVEKA